MRWKGGGGGRGLEKDGERLYKGIYMQWLLFHAVFGGGVSWVLLPVLPPSPTYWSLGVLLDDTLGTLCTK